MIVLVLFSFFYTFTVMSAAVTVLDKSDLYFNFVWQFP